MNSTARSRLACRLPRLLLPLALTTACRGDVSDFEGDDPGECEDKADNNADGKFDCSDTGCKASPDCAPPEEVVDTSDLDEDGYSAEQGDCDDADADIHPGADELPWTGVDEDCSASTLDDDLDQDGEGVAVDCDETDPTVGSAAASECHLLGGADGELPGEAREMQLGAALVNLGDQDGDGRADLAVGAPGAGNDAGAVLLFSGADLVQAGKDGVLDSTAEVARWTGKAQYDFFGEAGSLHRVPDRDGDGKDELLVGAPAMDPGGFASAGAVYLFTDVSDLSGEALAETAARTILQGRNAGDRFGTAIAVGDLDGDGVAEIIASSPQDDVAFSNGGVVAIFNGATLGNGVISISDADIQLTGGWTEMLGTGQAVVLGDVNGDGQPDLAVASQDASSSLANEAGLVFLVSGEGLVSGPIRDRAMATIEGEHYDDRLGSELLAPGDIDGDGVQELVVSALQGDHLTTDGGSIHLWWGGAGLAGSIPASAADLHWGGETGLSRAGSGLLGGDFDQDGTPDLVAAAPYRAGGGRLYGLSGADAASWVGGSLEADARLWVSAMGAEGAPPTVASLADVDGNGAPDLVVGAPAMDHGADLGAGGILLFLR